MGIEHTLKVMEETKTIFLEEIAVERPALIQELIRHEEAERDNEDDEGGGGNDAETDEKDQLARLAAEELEMRAELKKAQVALDALPAAAKDKDSFIDMLNIEIEEIAKALSALELIPTDEELPEEEIPDLEAIFAKLPKDDLDRLVSADQEKQRLVDTIESDHFLLEKLREEMLGVPEELLELPDPVDGEPPQVENVPDELVAEVILKRRELRALRKRWWMERQHDTCTVRRTLAVADLPKDPEAPDQAPQLQHQGLFERIVASMTYGSPESASAAYPP